MEGPVTFDTRFALFLLPLPLGVGWGAGFNVELPWLLPHPRPFSQREKGEKINYGFASKDESGRVDKPKACGFSPMIAAANHRGT
jgi:hypothetical protein